MLQKPIIWKINVYDAFLLLVCTLKTVVIPGYFAVDQQETPEEISETEGDEKGEMEKWSKFDKQGDCHRFLFGIEQSVCIPTD